MVRNTPFRGVACIVGEADYCTVGIMHITMLILRASLTVGYRCALVCKAVGVVVLLHHPGRYFKQLGLKPTQQPSARFDYRAGESRAARRWEWQALRGQGGGSEPKEEGQDRASGKGKERGAGKGKHQESSQGRDQWSSQDQWSGQWTGHWWFS